MAVVDPADEAMRLIITKIVETVLAIVSVDLLIKP